MNGRRFRIGGPDAGHVVDLNWAGWITCKELDKVKALEVGETAIRVLFHSGAGTTELDVFRAPDDTQLSK